MIDWFRGAIPFRHVPISGGLVMSISPEGVIDWQVHKGLQVRGSYESSLMIKSRGSCGDGSASHLWIDGNISKFLQGHNLFGSRDLVDLVYKTFTRITNDFKALTFDPLDGVSAEQSILAGDFDVKALDINQLYQLDNDRSVESWLYACEMQAHRRAGRSTATRGTVYIGKNSRRWAVKFYNKYREMLKNQEDSHPSYQRLLSFSQGLLRAELRLLSLELKDLGLTKGHHFTESVINELFASYMGRIEMTKNATLVDDQLMSLPRAAQATYQMWRTGISCREMLPKNTFYRHRRLLLDSGIDINFPPISPERNNVVPLLRIVEAVPIANPGWAYDLQLIA